jgi:dynein heavy chain
MVVDLHLQTHPVFILKVIQLFETFNVRFGVMLVGPTGSGKTTVWNVLQNTMTYLRE